MRGFRNLAIGGALCTPALALGGCGETAPTTRTVVSARADASAAARLVALRPVPAGHGRAFRLPARGERVSRAVPVGSLVCRRYAGRRVEAHLELFAQGRVVPIPPGIGIAPPLRRRGAYVSAGRCSYPVRTTEPTGLLDVRREKALSLGEVFDVWGQPLSRVRLASFRGSAVRPVRAYLDGVRWRGDPRAIPVRRHAVIVLELGRSIPPHARYRFPGGA